MAIEVNPHRRALNDRLSLETPDCSLGCSSNCPIPQNSSEIYIFLVWEKWLIFLFTTQKRAIRAVHIERVPQCSCWLKRKMRRAPGGLRGCNVNNCNSDELSMSQRFSLPSVQVVPWWCPPGHWRTQLPAKKKIIIWQWNLVFNCNQLGISNTISDRRL